MRPGPEYLLRVLPGAGGRGRGGPEVKRLALGLFAGGLLIALWAALARPREFNPPEQFPVLDPAEVPAGPAAAPDPPAEVATFGAGCFWCTEAVFRRVKGVTAAVPGYSGGSVPDPTYEQVCDGTTGHAEVVQVTFDPASVSYGDLLEVFWRSHDPTTPGRQGYDTGSQYRSVIFYHSDRQRELAERYKRKIDAAGVYPAPVVTEIVPFAAFNPAGPYHQDYYARNSKQPYCRAVIGRKLDKLKAVFGDRLLKPGD
jgi:peptide-methionine (S)-S-oxide reductase